MALRPYKVVAQVIAQRVDDDDNVIGELPVAEILLFAHELDQLDERITENWPKITARHDPPANGAPTFHAHSDLA